MGVDSRAGFSMTTENGKGAEFLLTEIMRPSGISPRDESCDVCGNVLFCAGEFEFSAVYLAIQIFAVVAQTHGVDVLTLAFTYDDEVVLDNVGVFFR